MKKIFRMVTGLGLLGFLMTGCGIISNGNNSSNNSENTNISSQENLPEFDGGNGTENNPYVISKPYQWANINIHLDSHYIIQSDLNLGDIKDLSPIGNNEHPFEGFIEGNHKTISNANITVKHICGLFGVVSGGTVKNLNFEQSSLKVNEDVDGDTIGSIAGLVKMGGLIENCHTKNVTLVWESLYTKVYIGGLVGTVQSSANVNYCSATKFIINAKTSFYPEPRYGGIIGLLDGGNLNACWSSGNINNSHNLMNSMEGGIACVTKWGDIKNCWSHPIFKGGSHVSTSGTIACSVQTEEALSYLISFAEFPGNDVTNRYYSCPDSVSYSEFINLHYSPSTISQSNSAIDVPAWANNTKLWKKGSVHPELVSYEEFLQLTSENKD